MKWVLAQSDDAVAAALSDKAGLHPLIARLMVNRGITEPAAVQAFLACDFSTLSSPGVFSQMPKAVNRIRKAIDTREKITVYGDYDVDGVTGTSLLFLVLRALGAQAAWYIPDRLAEGYGLNARALKMIQSTGTKLVISVDCGITASREAEAARSLGIDLIITDHHEFKNQDDGSGCGNSQAPVFPEAYAVLHPSLLDDGVTPEIREQVGCLTGVGVAFKLAQGLLEATSDDAQLQTYLDLVTLGTVADVGKITGENRLLVKHGLELLSSGAEKQRPGIAALKRVSGLDGKKISTGSVGFSIAPRLNAGGRLERADMSVRLLTTDSPEEALSLASDLDGINRERQSVEENIREAARRLCHQMDIDATGALVLCSEDWHPGVIGIVASRIVEEFYRPTALICLKDGVGKGSARSIPGFDLYAGLVSCSDLLINFGGHKVAAGFTIAKENIPQFRDRLGSLVLKQVGTQGFTRTLLVDAGVAPEEINSDLVRQIERMAPFGQGNPEARLGARGLEVVASRIVGSNHLKLKLRQQGAFFEAIAFNQGDLLGKQVWNGSRLAAVFTPRLNVWNGKTSLELDIKDIKTEK